MCLNALMWFSRRKEHKECKETEAPSLEGRLVLSSQCDSRLHTGVGLCSALHRFSALQENHPQLAVLDLQGLPGDCVSRCFALLLAFRTAARLLTIMANPCTSFPELTCFPHVSQCRTDSATLTLDLQYYYFFMVGKDPNTG